MNGNLDNIWRFHNPTQVIFGGGSFERIAEAIEGERIALITTPGFSRRGHVAKVKEMMDGRIVITYDKILPNPEIHQILDAIRFLGNSQIDSILALGGGSCIDTAKLISKTIVGIPPGNIEEIVTIAGAKVQGIPLTAVPTTSGTGSEVTPFATIWDMENRSKISIGNIYPRTAVLDYTVTMGAPRSATVYPGWDAIAHALDSIWNKNANPITYGLALESLKRSIPSLRALTTAEESGDLRNSMMESSLLSGLAISQTRTSISHSMSYALTIEFGVPHGLACSFSLPEILEYYSQKNVIAANRLATHLGYANVGNMIEDIASLMQVTGANEDLKRYCSTAENIMRISDRMHTSERMANFSVDSSPAIIESIISKTNERIWNTS